MIHLVGAAVAPTELVGGWALERRLYDRRAGMIGRVRGRVDFVAEDSDVRWLERGVLQWDGSEHEVTRELRVVPDGEGWMVRFDHGGDFHPWQPGTVVTHSCRADVYRGLIDVGPDVRSLRVLWDVSGPSKDQRIVTRCRRL